MYMFIPRFIYPSFYHFLSPTRPPPPHQDRLLVKTCEKVNNDQR